MSKNDFTPALGYRFLTPIYDLAIRVLTREEKWRGELAQMIAPVVGDKILDVGCGTGSLLIRLSSIEPRADFVGLDPDPIVLEIASSKAKKSGANITWKIGFLSDETAGKIGRVSKVASSLVFHQTTLAEKANILSTMRALLVNGGNLFVADYGLQRSMLMRLLFRMSVQVVDGKRNTQPNADGCLPEMMKAAGFQEVQETLVIRTATGSISLYKAVAV